MEALETAGKEAWECRDSLQGKLKCRLGGSQGHTRPHGGPEKLGSALQGASQEAGQAGVGSILSLELHGRRAVCPRDEVVFGEAAGFDVVLEQLLREVLVHLGSFVGVHCVPTGLVQVSQQGRRPQLNRHVWDLAGQLHGGHDHVVTLPVVAQHVENVAQEHQGAGREPVQVLCVGHLQSFSQKPLGLVVASLEEGEEPTHVESRRSEAV